MLQPHQNTHTHTHRFDLRIGEKEEGAMDNRGFSKGGLRIRGRCPCRRGLGRRGQRGQRRRGCGGSSESLTRGSRGRRSTLRSTGSCAPPCRLPSSPRFFRSAATRNGDFWPLARQRVSDLVRSTCGRLGCYCCSLPLGLCDRVSKAYCWAVFQCSRVPPVKTYHFKLPNLPTIVYVFRSLV
jgi:hypothetical protein